MRRRKSALKTITPRPAATKSLCGICGVYPATKQRDRRLAFGPIVWYTVRQFAKDIQNRIRKENRLSNPRKRMMRIMKILAVVMLSVPNMYEMGEDDVRWASGHVIHDVVITAYSSSVDETDNDPWITASGDSVHDGVIAYNKLPFGTKVWFPRLFGRRDFIVDDRMARRDPTDKHDHADIWMSSKERALIFGVKIADMVIAPQADDSIANPTLRKQWRDLSSHL